MTATPVESERYLDLKAAITGAAGTTGIATAIAALVQAVDNHGLRHREAVIGILYANTALLGLAFLIIAAVAVFKTQPSYETRFRAAAAAAAPAAPPDPLPAVTPLECGNRRISFGVSLAVHYTLAVIVGVTSIFGIILAALSGAKPDATPTPTTLAPASPTPT